MKPMKNKNFKTMKSIMFSISAIVLFVLLFGCTKKETFYENDNKPTIDFLQPWAFYEKNEEDIFEHFTKLNNIGIDTLIIQNIAKFDNGTPEVCYYDSLINFPKKYNDFLEKMLKAAKHFNIKIIVGLPNDSYWWSYQDHGYRSDVMNVFYEEESNVLKEILTKYEIDGIYYANEMFSNPHSYYKSWSKHLNKLLEDINSINPQMPFYISPFNSSAFLKNHKNCVTEWENFFKNVNFREIDYFMIQDGFGGCEADPKEREYKEIFERNTKIREKCLKYSKANFILNIELFASDGYTSKKRLEKQIAYANMLGNKIACFSVSHYFIDEEDIFK